MTDWLKSVLSTNQKAGMKMIEMYFDMDIYLYSDHLKCKYLSKSSEFVSVTNQPFRHFSAENEVVAFE